MNISPKSMDDVVRTAIAFFASEKVTPEGIRDFIHLIRPSLTNNIDEEKLFLKIESVLNVTIDGTIVTLEDRTGHDEWFNVSTNIPIKREFQWHFWDHLKNYLISYKGRTANMVENLDGLSSEILSRVEDPFREGAWDRRGMIMGSVQSGKTANYTALICKALDAGYKLIIILAGIHNSLRSQTQDRLNDELLGYDLDRIQRLTGGERRIGVRKIFSDPFCFRLLYRRFFNTIPSPSIFCIDLRSDG